VLKRFAIGLLAALITALIGPGFAASALPEIEQSSVHTYGYDSDLHAAGAAQGTTERGPPVVQDLDSTHDADGPRLRGASARSETSPRRSTITYAYPRTFAQVAGARTTTGRHEVHPDDELSSLPASQEAANGLDDSVVLVRGGTNTAERFANGSGVTSDAAAKGLTLRRSRRGCVMRRSCRGKRRGVARPIALDAWALPFFAWAANRSRRRARAAGTSAG
jgi:hypothetical protein